MHVMPIINNLRFVPLRVHARTHAHARTHTPFIMIFIGRVAPQLKKPGER